MNLIKIILGIILKLINGSKSKPKPAQAKPAAPSSAQKTAAPKPAGAARLVAEQEASKAYVPPIILCEKCGNNIPIKVSGASYRIEDFFCKICGTRTPLEDPDGKTKKKATGFNVVHQTPEEAANEIAKKYDALGIQKEGDFLFKVIDNGIEITSSTAINKSIQIPAQIQGKPVAQIGDKAFYQKSLTGVTIPATVTSIGKSAFSGNKISSIVIPGSVKTVGDGAFFKNPLTKIVIEEGTQSIGSSCFEYTTRFGEDRSMIDSVVIPSSMAVIGKQAFYNARIASVTISKGVKQIEEKAFYGNQLKTLVIPEGVTSIGDSAFTENFLTEVTFPCSLTTIGDCAFDAAKLTVLNLPPNLKTIGACAFNGNKLTELSLPDSVKTIGESAFSNNQIEKIKFSNSLSGIKKFTFEKNKIKGDIIIPESVKSIDEAAFRNNEITGVEIKGPAKIGKDAFAYNNITKLIISNGAQSIAAHAFKFNKNLTGAIIPEGVSIAMQSDNTEEAFDYSVYIERGDTAGLKLDDEAYWKSWEQKVNSIIENVAPKGPITLHDASGSQIGKATFADRKQFRGGRATGEILDSSSKIAGKISIIADYSYPVKTVNYAALDKGRVTPNGDVYHSPNEKLVWDAFVTDQGTIKTKDAAKVAQYKIGSVSEDGSAYDANGTKAGEARGAGEFAAVYAGAMLAYLLSK